MNKNIACAKIKALLNEAKDSFKRAISYVGPDERLGFMMLKWPDALDSMVNYTEEPSKANYDKVMKDISPLMLEPLFIVAESLASKRENVITKMSEIGRIRSFEPPALAKTKLVALIEEMTK